MNCGTRTPYTVRGQAQLNWHVFDTKTQAVKFAQAQADFYPGVGFTIYRGQTPVISFVTLATKARLFAQMSR